jgi:hypothetical protein
MIADGVGISVNSLHMQEVKKRVSGVHQYMSTKHSAKKERDQRTKKKS